MPARAAWRAALSSPRPRGLGSNPIDDGRTTHSAEDASKIGNNGLRLIHCHIDEEKDRNLLGRQILDFNQVGAEWLGFSGRYHFRSSGLWKLASSRPISSTGRSRKAGVTLPAQRSSRPRGTNADLNKLKLFETGNICH